MTGNYYVFDSWQGETFNRLLRWKNPDMTPVDISGMTARMQLRVSAKSSTAALELTEANGGITLDGVEGTIRLYIPAETMSALQPIVYVYDLELEDQMGNAERLIWGKFRVRPEVTR